MFLNLSESVCVPPYGDGYCFREGGGHKNLTRFVQIWLPVEIEVTGIYITYCRSDISLLRTSSYLIYTYTILYIYIHILYYIYVYYTIYIYFDICMYQYHMYIVQYTVLCCTVLNIKCSVQSYYSNMFNVHASHSLGKNIIILRV